MASEWLKQLAAEAAGKPPAAPQEKSQTVAQPQQAQRKTSQWLQNLAAAEVRSSPYYKYAILTQADDFAEKSKYTSTANGYTPSAMAVAMGMTYFDESRSGWDDPLYEHINGNTDATNWLRNHADAVYGGGLSGVFGVKTESKQEAKQMAKDEIAIYNYIHATQGKEAAREYYDYIRSDLYARDRADAETYWAEEAKKDPVGTSVFSAVTSPLKVFSYLGQLADVMSGKEIDPNNPYNSFVYENNAIRNQVANDIKKNWGDVGSFSYQIGMSLVDSLIARGLAGGSGVVALMITGSGLAARETIDAIERGVDSDKAFLQGTIIGVIEGAAEQWSVGNLLNPELLADGSVKYILKNMLAEGEEEAATEFANTLVDIFISQDKSRWNLDIQAYMKQGLTEQEAFAKAVADKAVDIGISALGGSISGGVMAGTGAGLNSIIQKTGVGNYGGTNVQGTTDGKTNAQNNENTQGNSGGLQQAINNTQETATGGQQASQQFISDALDDTIAQLTGAPVDPVGAALEGFRQSGAVTNKQATDILNSARAVTALVEQTGVKLDGLTASQKRQNVKNAISQMAQNQQAEGQNESTSVNTDPAQHTPQEQSVIDDYQNAVDDNLVEYIQTVKDNPGQKMPRYPLKDVSSRAAEDIKRITGVDVSGHKTQMESRMVEHIIKDHGEHGITDQSMRDVNDIARIQYVIDNYDSIEHGGTSSAYVYQNQHGRNANAQTVVMKKKVNGTYFVVEAVPDTSKKTVFITSAYMSKDGKQKAAASLSGDAEAPRFTPKSATKNTAVDEDVMRYHKANASGAIASPSSSNNVAQRSPNVNPNESVGAAPAGFAGDFTRMQMEHGNLRQGENPVRPDDMPKSTDGNDRVSHTAVTVKGAKVTPDEFIPLLERDVTEGGMSYIPITNNETVQKAMDKISEEGWEVALGSWQASVESGKTGADLVATGSLLLNNAAHAGDKSTWLDVLHDFQQLGTNTAQGLQAFRILKKLNPSDKLYMVRRSIKQMVRDMHLGMEITVDPELETAYRNAETDEARDAVLKKIQKNVASQIPATFMEKFTKLRYVNMLGNLRTQGRNIVGNLGMKAVRSAHNAIAAGIENLAGKASGGKLQRTRSATVSKAQKAAAAKDFDGLKTAILDGGKYSDSTADTIGFARGVQEQRQIFRFKPMEGYRKVVNWAMEQGDLIFAKDAYARALAGYLKANGITETDYSKIDTAILDDARLFAAKEAQEATFRDTNWLSGWVSKVGRRKDTPAAVKVISEGIMPFRKTPANVLVRAEEYSPLGVINSIVASIKSAQPGSDVTGAQVINSWAKTLTGTGIFGLGMLLQNLGLLSAGPDEDEDKDRFDSMNGWQNYALTLPDGTNLTIDFLTPAAIPLLMGAELMQLMRNDGFSLKDIESSLSAIADPMVEMSMLQGVNDTLDNIQYADDNLGQLLINSCLSYLTQGLTNTLAGQLERTFEDSRMTTYVDKDSDLPDWLQRAIGKASAKIPGLDYNQIPYINAWGEEEENPEWYLNGAYNLLSPSYIEKGVSSDLTQELNRLNGVQSDVNVYPSAPDKSVTYNSQKYNLSAEEYVSLAKQQGQKQKTLVEDILASSAYADLSDADKAKAISYAYEYARDYARMEVLPDYPGFSSKWMEELKGDIAEGIIRKTVVGTTEKYASLPIEKASYVDDLLDSILPPAGKTYATQQQKIDAVTGADGNLTDKEQRTVLKDVLSDSAYDKFLEILELGYSNDDYADSYRIYSKEKETGGKGTKARTIAAFQKKFGISENAATTLYEIYNPK